MMNWSSRVIGKIRICLIFDYNAALLRLLILAVLLSFGFAIDTTVAAEEAGDVKNATLKNMFSGGEKGDIPVFIKSDSLKLDTKRRVFIYDGNVEIRRGEVRITADRVVGQYDDKNRLQTVLCEDNVVVTRGEDLRASSNKAVYRIENAVVELTEGPELIRDGNALAANKITIFVDEDRSEAEGDVRVKVIKTEQQGRGSSVKERISGLGDDKSSEPELAEPTASDTSN